jgi:hypothetical protein
MSLLEKPLFLRLIIAEQDGAERNCLICDLKYIIMLSAIFFFFSSVFSCVTTYELIDSSAFSLLLKKKKKKIDSAFQL